MMIRNIYLCVPRLNKLLYKNKQLKAHKWYELKYLLSLNLTTITYCSSGVNSILHPYNPKIEHQARIINHVNSLFGINNRLTINSLINKNRINKHYLKNLDYLHRIINI